MAAAYAEPSPNLCAHVLLLSCCSVRLFRCRTSSQLLCAEKSCPPSPDGVGDGAWMAGGCQHSCLLSGARAEIYLTWTDGGACATSASVEDFAAKSAHATWFQVYTTGTVRVRSNRGVATKKAAQP